MNFCPMCDPSVPKGCDEWWVTVSSSMGSYTDLGRNGIYMEWGHVKVDQNKCTKVMLRTLCADLESRETTHVWKLLTMATWLCDRLKREKSNRGADLRNRSCHGLVKSGLNSLVTNDNDCHSLVAPGQALCWFFCGHDLIQSFKPNHLKSINHRPLLSWYYFQLFILEFFSDWLKYSSSSSL